MSRGTLTLLHSWHCSACGFDWISGEVLAAFMPTVKGVEALRAAAAAGELPMRALQCPTCRTGSLRVVKAAGVVVDLCPRCVGVALDPGELRAFKSIGYGPARRVLDVVDVVSGVDALLQLLTSLG